MVLSAASDVSLIPWQRLDAAWPALPDSPTGLDVPAQRMVRRLLTEAVGRRLRMRRSLPPESLFFWQARPHLARYVRKPRFFANLLHCYALVDTRQFLRTEAALALEVLETPPSLLGADEWQKLLALQCQRLGQLYAHLRERIGAVAQDELHRALNSLISEVGA
ncbi:MAG TPA: hypothetical protein VH599_16035 [Ktedonobacterales bacterium]|jgi:hypothetical protein